MRSVQRQPIVDLVVPRGHPSPDVDKPQRRQPLLQERNRALRVVAAPTDAIHCSAPPPNIQVISLPLETEANLSRGADVPGRSPPWLSCCTSSHRADSSSYGTSTTHHKHPQLNNTICISVDGWSQTYCGHSAGCTCGTARPVAHPPTHAAHP